MRIVEPMPDPPSNYQVASFCTFCDEFVQVFLILEHGESIAVICIECVHKIANEALARWGDRPISRA